ncbi:DUF4435 domain-containing protein [Rhizobium hidalgonense]|uniref:DUF4435 domain-containing protein n=1 Tax=Rhizobium hidalgonense TaxID=1538159 RepID=UPI0013E3EB81|nr:DUF4435 domain-containing protein [Rhizobium hidalgonense]
MSDNTANADNYIERMKEAKDKAAVLKYRLVTTRGDLPDAVIFVFEGDDDKTVYFNWVSRICPELEYEPFTCRGKRKVLQLRDVVLRDKSDLADGIYFFVDRDFDDLQGHPEHENTFMTDRYSVENYLVDDVVLKEFLKNEFHCHGNPKVREPIIRAFGTLYERFLKVTEHINLRVFLARKLGINASALPDRINALVTLQLSSVTVVDTALPDIVRLDREPTEAEILALLEEFSSLAPSHRYRGKFSLKFFEKWLELLAADYGDDNTIFFGSIDRVAKVKRSEITLGSMASKSPHPHGLPDFLQGVEAPSKQSNAA